MPDAVGVAHDGGQSGSSDRRLVVDLEEEIDPQQASYVDYLGWLYVGEVNQQVLRTFATEGQKDAANLQSNLKEAHQNVAALRQALVDLQAEKRFETVRQQSELLRGYLADAGFSLVGSDCHASPAVVSIALPDQLSSLHIGEAMERRGWLLSYLSGYLLERNIIQICLMGSVAAEQCLQMVQTFVDVAADCCQVQPD